MTVTWVTLENTTNPVVKYGTSEVQHAVVCGGPLMCVQGVFTTTVNASTHTFDIAGWNGYVGLVCAYLSH